MTDAGTGPRRRAPTAALRRAGPEQRQLLGALLDVLVRQAERGRGARAGRRAPGG